MEPDMIEIHLQANAYQGHHIGNKSCRRKKNPGSSTNLNGLGKVMVGVSQYRGS